MWTRSVATTLALLSLTTTASAEVRLQMSGGRVTISAKNATVSQILAEWARVGDTRIVNAERIAGAPLTLELTNVPELQALEILLRGAGGYVIAPRTMANAKASASAFDRILIVPASTNVVRPVTAPAPTPRPNVPINRDNEANDAPPAAPRFAPVTREDTESATPETPVSFTPGPTLNGAPGVARPGMVMPAPPTPPTPPQR